MQYITRCRIALAKSLLEETNLSVNEIAVKCGYEDVINFFRNFKKSENTTPLAYRIAVTGTQSWVKYAVRPWFGLFLSVMRQ